MTKSALAGGICDLITLPLMLNKSVYCPDKKVLVQLLSEYLSFVRDFVDQWTSRRISK